MFVYAEDMTLRQGSFQEMGTPLSDVPFCVLDLETTGLSPDTCSITEIGAVTYVGGEEIGRFQTLVDPGCAIPPTVTVVTGITRSMVVDAPSIGEALPSFLEFLGDAVIVGHNVRFDLSFLNAASLSHGYGKLPNLHTDTLRLAQRLVRSEVRSMKLRNLAAYFGSPVAPNHRALDDALATAHVFWSLLERAGSIGVTHLDDLLALPTIKGARAVGKLALTDRLPRRPGVYTFKDATGTPIYIGKATNLRSRVRSYFAGDARKSIDAMLRDLHTIDHLETCGEIDASVLELRAIAVHKPVYNKRSKPPQSLHWVHLTSERYPRLSVARSPVESRLVLGPFRSRRTATDAMHALWDATGIRRCTGRGNGCAHAQSGQTACPCSGAMSESDYERIVQSVVDGVARPELLIDPIQRRMVQFASTQRFEDAALVRDRWAALALAIHRAGVWADLQAAGCVQACGPDSVCLTIDRGRMSAAWRSGTSQPFALDGASDITDSPPSMEAADEAMLLWRWLMQPGIGIVSHSGPLPMPREPMQLAMVRRGTLSRSPRW